MDQDEKVVAKPTTSFKDVVSMAKKSIVRRRAAKYEWRKFTDQELKFLETLDDVSKGLSLIHI